MNYIHVTNSFVVSLCLPRGGTTIESSKSNKVKSYYYYYRIKLDYKKKKTIIFQNHFLLLGRLLTHLSTC